MEEVDRISRLPDEVLTHILSFMPTKEAAATSILSKRWECLWTGVPVLDFYKCDFDESFEHFVDRALILNNAPFLRLFRLHAQEEFKDLHLFSWIRHVLTTRNVYEVNVECPTFGMGAVKEKLSGWSIVNEKLKVLKLDGFLHSPPWFPFSKLLLPNLLILHLESFDFGFDVSMNDVFPGLPSLTEFVIRGCVGLDSLSISSSSLKRLEINRTLEQVLQTMINAPRLEHLLIEDTVFNCLFDIQVPSLVEAHFNFCFWGDDAVRSVQIFEQIPSLKTLSVTSPIQRICKEVAKLRLNQLPLFPNLTCLDVTCFIGPRHPLSYLNMLLLLCENAPNLVLLKYGCKRRMCRRTDEPFKLSITVPKCLTSTLKVIDVYNIQRGHNAVTEYFVRHATVLKRVRIHLNKYSAEPTDALSGLFKIPAASSTCEFIIHVSQKCN